MTKLINKLLSEREAARRLGLRIATLQRWRWAGKGPRFLKIEGAVRYDPFDLADFVAASVKHARAWDRRAGNRGGDPRGKPQREKASGD